ncbi:hypothetical protein WMZ97_13225 [Lentibacillus sp. N15]|uniref:hypothetical protein n=1 Tax=Lentibacillus songyuanensis TaxID=3136161 RepID=UPI0031B9B165
MSDKTKKPQPQKQTKTAEKEQTYYLHDLRAHSQELFGVKPEVFDGAFYHEKEPQITKSYAENRIKTFLNKEVKQ